MDKDLDAIVSGKGLSESSTTTQKTGSGTTTIQRGETPGTRIDQYTYRGGKNSGSDK